MLAVGVVDVHHGEVEQPCAVAGTEPVDAGGGFLAAADEPVAQVPAVAVEQVGEVAAVIDDQVGMAGERFAQIAGVLRPVGTVVRVDGEPLGGERGGNVILRGEGIAAGDVNLGAARVEHLGEVGGLGFEVDGHGDAHPAEGLGAFKFGADGVQNGHIGPHPVDLVSAARGGFGRGNVRVGHGISFMEKYGISIKRAFCGFSGANRAQDPLLLYTILPRLSRG